ncbi:MAG: HAD family phosphatase [Candidatus Micrarchaeota archaeon]
MKEFIVKAIIFDMDGVLIDSQDLHFKAEIQTVKQFGHKITKKELIEYLGWNERAFWTEIIKKYNINTTVEELQRIERPIYEEILQKNLKEDKKLQKLLKNLKTKNLKLAVASSSPRRWIKMVLVGLKIEEFFDIIVAGDEIKNSKPNPEIFLRAAKKLEIAPQECIVIEDAPAGIKGANKAGMKSIALITKINKNLDLSEAKFKIEKLEEIEKIL